MSPRRRSIDIRFPQRKSVTDQVDLRFCPVAKHYLDDIKANEDIRVIEQAEPSESAAGNSLLLLARDRFGRRPKIRARPSLYFNEHERFPMAADDVDFAAGPAAEVPVENFVAVPPEEPTRERFPTRAPFEVFRPRRARRRDATAPLVQTSDDGWGKGHVRAIS